MSVVYFVVESLKTRVLEGQVVVFKINTGETLLLEKSVFEVLTYLRGKPFTDAQFETLYLQCTEESLLADTGQSSANMLKGFLDAGLVEKLSH